MTLLSPFWLMLFLPAAALFLRRRLPSRFLNILHAAAIGLAVLAMCRPAVKLWSESGVVVVLADRSRSMPEDSQTSQVEAINLVRSGMTDDDLMGVVSFGERAIVERRPKRGEFPGFVQDAGNDRSNLGRAIQKALAMIPENSSGRILVLSDGEWTGDDPAKPSANAAARSVSIDYRSYRRQLTGDVCVARFEVPETVAPKESFLIRARIEAPDKREAKYNLYRGKTLISSGKTDLSPGHNFLLFRDTAQKPGALRYKLEIDAGGDPVPGNNRAEAFTGVRGPRPVLCVSDSGNSGLAGLLKKSGLEVKAAPPEKVLWSLGGLSGFSGLVIENVSADRIGVSGMENIAAWVGESGAGMMMTGGMNAYGPGGYFRSPLEPILPVSMELRREHRKLALAIVIVLDRSGSMGMQAEGGRTKMDLANIGAAQVLDLLTPMDEFGVIAVDSAPHTIVDLATVDGSDGARRKVLRIDSGGGGIFVYEGLFAAAEMLQKAKAGTRHIILFADAADAENPGEYKELLAKCGKAGITVSVIGLGTPADTDAELLEDVASRGKGGMYFTIHPSEIPRLFARDTFNVMRNAFIKEPASVRKTAALLQLAKKPFGKFPEIGGYNLCYTRPEANPALVTEDEYKAPALAFWQAGRGRAVCYTGEADGKYTGSMAGWEQTGDFFASLARWTCGDNRDLPDDMLITRELVKGALKIELHLDPERTGEPFPETPRVNVLRGETGKKPHSETHRMEWSSPDTLEANITISGSETILPTLETGMPGTGSVTLSPACLPYSPEFAPLERSEDALRKLAQMTGGKERSDLTGIWEDMPAKRRYVEIGHWLAVLASVVFLVAVFQRRTGLLSEISSRKSPKRKDSKTKVAGKQAEKKVAKPIPEPEAEVEVEVEKKADSETKDALDAMQRAKRLAGKRMER